MKDIYNKDRKIFFELLEDKQIKKEDIPFLCEVLGSSKNEEDIYQVYRFFRNNPEYIDYDAISKTTGIDKDVLVEIFTKNPVKSYFPVANKNDADIITAYIFKLSKKSHKHAFIEKDGIDNVRSLIDDGKIPIKDFFVIFDKGFTGNSYLLSVVAGLLLDDKVLSDYAFTGEVNKKGDIIPVNFLEAKRKACNEKGLKLISPQEVQNIDELTFFMGSKEMDVPFLVLNKDKTEIERSLEKIEQIIKKTKAQYSLDKLLKIFSLEKEDFYVETSNVAPQEEVWMSLLNRVKDKLQKIYSSLNHPKITLHIATSIASLSVGIGVILGIKRSYVIYHFQNEEYFPVLHLDTPQSLRSLKQTTKDILEHQEFINIDMHIENSESINLILHLASHNPVADVVSFTKNQSYVYISDKRSQGNLPLDEELWRGYLSEVYSLINILKARYLIKRFDLFISCPSAMALALGMIVGNYFDINVYNYYRNLPEKYFRVFNITELETPF